MELSLVSSLEGDVASDVLAGGLMCGSGKRPATSIPFKGSAIWAWMATIARNRALDEVRRVRPVSLEDQPEGFEPAAEEVQSARRARPFRGAREARQLP